MDEELSLESLDRRLRVVERVLGLDQMAVPEELPMPVAPPVPVEALAQGMSFGGGGPTPPLRRRGAPPAMGLIAPPPPPME